MKKLLLILIVILYLFPNKVWDNVFSDTSLFFEARLLSDNPFKIKKNLLTDSFKIQKNPNDLLSVFFQEKDPFKNTHPCLLENKAVFEEVYPTTVINQAFQQVCSLNNPDAYFLDFPTQNQLFFKKDNRFCNSYKKCLTLLHEKDDIFILEDNNTLMTFLKIKPHHLKKVDLCPDPKKVLPQQLTDAYFNQVRIGFHNNVGMGNQLFEYWSGVVYAKKYHKKVFLENYPDSILPLFDLKEHEEACAFLDKGRTPEQQKLENFIFQYLPHNAGSNNALQEKGDYLKIDGFLQAAKNLKGYEKYIQQKTVLAKRLPKKDKKVIAQMQKENAVAIHVRRGDYLNHKGFYNELTSEYYQKAINYISQHVDKAHFYVFSNGMDWAKENLSSLHPNITFVDWTKHDWEDLTLMRSCKHFIIANSTFSWWGAFLGQDPDKIVIIPKNWIITDPFWGQSMNADNWIVFDNKNE